MGRIRPCVTPSSGPQAEIAQRQTCHPATLKDQHALQRRGWIASTTDNPPAHFCPNVRMELRKLWRMGSPRPTVGTPPCGMIARLAPKCRPGSREFREGFRPYMLINLYSTSSFFDPYVRAKYFP